MNRWLFFLWVFLSSCSIASTTLQRLEESLNDLFSLQARFFHEDSTGKKYAGTLFLERPWKLRMQYDSPSPFLIVSDNQALIYEDHTTFEAIYLPLESSPLSFLLDQQTKFEKALKIKNIQEQGDKVILFCEDKKNYFSLILYFSKKEKSITGWISRDAQGHEVKITLDTIQRNIPLKSDLFRFQQKPRWLTKLRGPK